MSYHQDMVNEKQNTTRTNEVQRRKQQSYLVQLLERKIRSRAQKLYEERGCVDGFALQDWVQAESEVLGKTTLASGYWRLRGRIRAVKRMTLRIASLRKISLFQNL